MIGSIAVVVQDASDVWELKTEVIKGVSTIFCVP